MNQEPVAYISKNGVVFKELPPSPIELEPLYTHPVKELTDEEIWTVAEETRAGANFYDRCDFVDFARAILRKAQE